MLAVLGCVWMAAAEFVQAAAMVSLTSTLTSHRIFNSKSFVASREKFADKRLIRVIEGIGVF